MKIELDYKKQNITFLEEGTLKDLKEIIESFNDMEDWTVKFNPTNTDKPAYREYTSPFPEQELSREISTIRYDVTCNNQ